MSRQRKAPVSPKLDAALENYYSLDGWSIKSILSMAARGTTDPVALNRRDVSSEVFALLIGLTEEESNEMREYYLWRQIGDKVTRLASRARQEARNIQRKRRFKTGVKEIQRRYRERG